MPERASPPPGSSTPAYAAAGVDVDANERLIPRYRALAAGATRPEVVGGLGAFSGLFDLSGFEQPLLVASTDGVGTKVLIARLLDALESVGEDLVNHCVNDILTAGARPLFFLDYLAGHGLSEDQKVRLVAGVARGCRAAGMALLGGETADMPDVYQPGDFDLAGTIVGVVAKGRQIDGSRVAPGDVLIGLASSGLHTNGYTLARAALGLGRGAQPEQRAALRRFEPSLGSALGEALLRPHRAYWPLLERALDRCHGIAHITGGGIPGNLVRVLPPGTKARVRRGTWPEPPIFALIRRQGEIGVEEMFRVFNMGLGLIVVVGAEDEAAVVEALGEGWRVGEVLASGEAPAVEVLSA